ncbi:MAG: NADH-quinone oxidoreductase subunit C [Bryobacteraceae bacterium]
MLPEAVAQDADALAINEELPDAIVEARVPHGEVELVIAPEHLVAACKLLKDRGYQQLSGVTGVDWWPREPRFEVVYFLRSFQNNWRLRLIVRAAEDQEIDSVTSVWRGANWYEREVFDLFGVTFRNHPSLERIMMPADWEGFPLRRDYPIHGHKYSYGRD